MPDSKRNNIIYCSVVFFTIFLAYITSPIITPYDSRWSVHTSMSIIQEGNTDLDEYKDELIENEYYVVEKIGDHYYSVFPVGTSLLAVPFVAIANSIFEPLILLIPSLDGLFKKKLAQHGIQVDELQFINIYPAVELVTASLFCAGTAVVIFLIAGFRLPTAYSLLVVFIFAFCTSSWSTSSRALWQHGPSMLMLSFVLYLLIIAKKNRNYICYLAVPLSLAFIIRPTNAIPVFFISLYVFIKYRQYFLKYLLLALPFALLYFAYNPT